VANLGEIVVVGLIATAARFAGKPAF